MLGCDAVLGVDVAKEVEMGVDFYDFGKELFVAVVYVVIKVEDAVGRAVGYQHIGAGGDFGDVPLLSIGYAIAHKHRHAIKFHAVNFDS